MAKSGFRAGKTKRDLGKAIMNAWDRAITANPGDPRIDRMALLADLDGILDKTFKAQTGRTIEYDVVFDTDLDATTRLVWLVIPTPDRDIPGGGGDDTWSKYKMKFYDSLNANQKKAREEEIADAIIFGCGR